MGIFGNGVNGLGGGGGASSSTSGGFFNLKTGAAAAINSIMTLGPDGLAYPAETTDYVAKTNIGDVAGGAQISTGYAQHYDRQPVYRASNGDIYTAGANAANGFGMAVYRYSAAGALLGKLVVSAFSALNYDPHMVVLSSGNFAVTYSDGIDLYYAVVDQTLAFVKSPTLVDPINPDQKNSIIALGGGGFMITWHHKATVIHQKIAVFSNAGSVVTASALIMTWAAGQSSAIHSRMVELSNGNIAIAYQSAMTGTPGLYIGVVSPLGAIVVAFTNYSTDPTVISPEIAAMPGFFCVSIFGTGTNTFKTFVFTNAAVQQGATYSVASLNATSGQHLTSRLISDGSVFWFAFYDGAADFRFKLVKITAAGVVAATHLLGNVGISNSLIYFDMFIEWGRIVITSLRNDQGVGYFTVFNLTTLLQESVAQSLGGMLGVSHKVIPAGDFTFLIAHGGNTGSGSTTGFSLYKYANATIIGVAATAAAAGGFTPVATLAGAYTINTMKGSPVKVFDHKSATIPGNAGVLLTYGAVLKGLV